MQYSICVIICIIGWLSVVKRLFLGSVHSIWFVVPFPILGVILHCPASMLVHVVLIVNACPCSPYCWCLSCWCQISHVCFSSVHKCSKKIMLGGNTHVFTHLRSASDCYVCWWKNQWVCCLLFAACSSFYMCTCSISSLCAHSRSSSCIVCSILSVCAHSCSSSHIVIMWEKINNFCNFHGSSCSVFSMSQPVLNVSTLNVSACSYAISVMSP